MCVCSFGLVLRGELKKITCHEFMSSSLTATLFRKITCHEFMSSSLTATLFRKPAFHATDKHMSLAPGLFPSSYAVSPAYPAIDKHVSLAPGLSLSNDAALPAHPASHKHLSLPPGLFPSSDTMPPFYVSTAPHPSGTALVAIYDPPVLVPMHPGSHDDQQAHRVAAPYPTPFPLCASFPRDESLT